MKMRFRKPVEIILLAVLVCFSMDAVAQNGHRKFRVLGYLHSKNNWLQDAGLIDLSMVTDLNLAFINPDSSGNFTANEVFNRVVHQAHQKKVKVFCSLGGGSPPAYLKNLLTVSHRARLISGLVAFAEKYHFDGVDIDIENDFINADYAPFISELAAAVKPANKLLTCALAAWNSNLIGDSTLKLFDYISIMSYDKTGPWNLSKPGPHSTYDMAQEDFNYFNKTRNIDVGKLLIGLPFYGYGFGKNAPSSVLYKDIIKTYKGSENADVLELPAGGKIYYNGIGTIKQKVFFAKERKASGVMIWELKQDSNDSTSLLRAINNAINH